jgi:hypothetical protein
MLGESGEEYAEVTRIGGPPTYLRVGPTVEQKREALIGLARADYLRGDLTVEAFEARVADILADRPVEIATSDGGRVLACVKPWKSA